MSGLCSRSRTENTVSFYLKLLLDQNISHCLIKRIKSLYPGSLHVRLVNLHSASDETIWKFAKEKSFIIVTKDSDFHQRSFLYGFPPKVIWIVKGNCITSDIEKILKANVKTIQKFYRNPKAAYLILS